MYGSFVLETVTQWLASDLARQESGTPDSLEYLSRSYAFLMDAYDRQKKMGQLCGLVGGGQKAQLLQVEATYPTLKECGIDTSKMEAAAEHLRAQSKLLEDIAGAHSGNASMVLAVIDRVDARIHSVLTGQSTSDYKARPN